MPSVNPFLLNFFGTGHCRLQSGALTRTDFVYKELYIKLKRPSQRASRGVLWVPQSQSREAGRSEEAEQRQSGFKRPAGRRTTTLHLFIPGSFQIALRQKPWEGTGNEQGTETRH